MLKKAPRLNKTSKRIAYDRYFNTSEKKAADIDMDAAYLQMCNRVARNVAAAEVTEEDRKKYYEIFTELMYNQDMIPAGRFWSNTGSNNSQFSNCFVYPIYDSKESIFNTLKLSAITFSNGGGIGYDFSRLRSRGMSTSTSKGTSSGPVSFLKLYDAMADTIVQGGTRRAATMGILRVDHPDILEFIFLKDKSQKYKRFNLSVAITDAFMKSLHEYSDDPWIVTDPKTQFDYKIFIPCGLERLSKDAVVKFLMNTYVDVRGEDIPNYMLRDLHLKGDDVDSSGGFYITSKDIWDCITYNAWHCGDPGLFFIDEVNRTNCLISDTHDITHCNYIRATNPCGEEAMEDDSICMLLSLNLANFVIFIKNPPVESWNNMVVNYTKIKTVVKIGIRFLDDALDVSTYPSEYIKQHALDTRRIGLGVMGWADMLIKLKIKYGSKESLALAEEVMKTINCAALEASIELGKERGNFPLFNQSCYYAGDRGFSKLKTLRNSYRTMTAPTGTTSLLTGVNEGIEPVFYFYYERKDETGVHTVENYLYKQWRGSFSVKKDPAISAPDYYITTNAPDYFITTNEISYDQHIDMQAAFQKYIDVAISKTINMPSHSTVEDVANAYLYAYKKKCKGITIYRDLSKDVQVLNAPSSDKKEIQIKHSVSREEGILAGLTWKVKTGDGTCFISINKNGDGNPVEVFISVGKAGSDINAYSEALGRIISIALQHKVAPEIITKQLIGILGDSPVFHKVGKYHKILSVPDAVGKVLEEFLNKSSHLMYSGVLSEAALKEENDIVVNNTNKEICSKCQQLIYESEGCKVCGCGSLCDE